MAKALYDCVKEDGLLIFTTHGKVSNKNHLKLNMENGYAFDAASEQGDIDSADYSTTVSEYEYVERMCRQYLQKYPEKYEEAYWWEHQDLYVIQK